MLTQLLERGVPVRAVVRSAERLPAGAAGNPLLAVVEADLMARPIDRLAADLDGCSTVISCLGHTISFRGVFGQPRNLVEQAVHSIRRAAETRDNATALRLILMSSVSVNQPDQADARRGRGERAALAVMRRVLPPARDNQRAADWLAHEVGPADSGLEWVAVRPDVLHEGESLGYTVHEGLVTSLFAPGHTRRAAVAQFMCDLATDDALWQRWRGRMPAIVDARDAI